MTLFYSLPTGELTQSTHHHHTLLQPDLYGQLTANFSLHTYVSKEDLWFNSLVENLQTIRSEPGFQDLERTVKDEALLVVGAGPSIKADDLLEKAARFRGKIVSTDRMLKPCLMEGIKVDYVINVDGDPACIPFFAGKNSDLVDRAATKSGTKLILNVFSHPSVVKFWKGERYWLIPAFDEKWVHPLPTLTRGLYKITNGKSVMYPLGNVGAFAWEVARYMSDGPPVYLIGMDYSDGLASEIKPQDTEFYNAYVRQAAEGLIQGVFPGYTKEGTALIPEARREETAKEWVEKVAYQRILNPWGNEVLTSLFWLSQRATFFNALKVWLNDDIGVKKREKPVQTINCSPLSILFLDQENPANFRTGTPEELTI